MARRRYRKYYRRKGIWSTRIQNIGGSQSVTAGNKFIISYDLCKNPVQTNDTVSQKFTVKNINCQLELETSTSGSNNIDNLQAYVMFLPQGWSEFAPSYYKDFPFDHPEWIMAYRYFGSCQNGTSASINKYPPLKLFTRLARKLDTGDRIILLILGSHTGTQDSLTLNYQGLVKYNTKAN